MKKWTPQGELDRPWQFDTESDARESVKKIGYTEHLKGYFVLDDLSESKFNNKPTAVKLQRKEQNEEEKINEQRSG